MNFSSNLVKISLIIICSIFLNTSAISQSSKEVLNVVLDSITLPHRLEPDFRGIYVLFQDKIINENMFNDSISSLKRKIEKTNKKVIFDLLVDKGHINIKLSDLLNIDDPLYVNFKKRNRWKTYDFQDNQWFDSKIPNATFRSINQSEIDKKNHTYKFYKVQFSIDQNFAILIFDYKYPNSFSILTNYVILSKNTGQWKIEDIGTVDFFCSK